MPPDESNVRPPTDPAMQAASSELADALTVIKTRHDMNRRELLSTVAKGLDTLILAPATP